MYKIDFSFPTRFLVHRIGLGGAVLVSLEWLFNGGFKFDLDSTPVWKETLYPKWEKQYHLPLPQQTALKIAIKTMLQNSD